jgi:hypothetical protein
LVYAGNGRAGNNTRAMLLLELIASVFTLAGAYLVSGKEYKEGFYYHFIGDFGWIVYGLMTNQYFLMITAIVFFHISVKGFRNHT